MLIIKEYLLMQYLPIAFALHSFTTWIKPVKDDDVIGNSQLDLH